MNIKLNGTRLYYELCQLLSCHSFENVCPICGHRGFIKNFDLMPAEQNKEVKILVKRIIKLLKDEAKRNIKNNG